MTGNMRLQLKKQVIWSQRCGQGIILSLFVLTDLVAQTATSSHRKSVKTVSWASPEPWWPAWVPLQNFVAPCLAWSWRLAARTTVSDKALLASHLNISYSSMWAEFCTMPCFGPTMETWSLSCQRLFHINMGLGCTNSPPIPIQNFKAERRF